MEQSILTLVHLWRLRGGGGGPLCGGGHRLGLVDGAVVALDLKDEEEKTHSVLHCNWRE